MTRDQSDDLIVTLILIVMFLAFIVFPIAASVSLLNYV